MDWGIGVEIARYIEEPFGWSVGDEDVDVVGNRLPHGVEIFAWSHVSPVEEFRGIGSAEYEQPVKLGHLVNQKTDSGILLGTNKPLLDRDRMIARDEDLGRDIECQVPLEKGSCFGPPRAKTSSGA